MVFYEMEVGRERKLVEGSDANDWESIVCSKNPDHQRAGRRLTALSVDILSRDIPDFTRTMLSDVVVTDRVRAALQNAKLTGFIFNPVDVARTPKRRGDAIYPKLWELVVVGSGGAADKASGIVKLRECSECRLVEYSAFKSGIVVDASVYDESDFFAVLEYPKYVLVSERAKAVMAENHFRNVSFLESTKLKWPSGVVEPT
jgi:hypothetical protein